MKLILSSVLALVCFLGFAGQVAAAPIVTFYTDRTAWENAMASFSTVDFEGIVADGTWGTTECGTVCTSPSTVVDGVTFANSTSPGTVAIAGKTSSISGSPYDSALLVSYNSGALIADLTSAGSGYTGAGGFFGDTDSSGSQAILTLTGSTGQLDQRTVVTADMGAGTPANFFGWTVEGDTILSVKHSLLGDYEGIDDFSYGRVSEVPIPAAAWLFLSALGGLGILKRKRL